VSITKISGLGSAAICLLLLVVIGIAYSHNRATSDILETNISIATPARDTLKRVDGLIGDSAFQLAQFVNRDPIVADDVLDLLNRLVASEQSLSEAIARDNAGAGLPRRHGLLARTAFYSFQDEQENDPASDTTIALKDRVADELNNLRKTLSGIATSRSEGRVAIGEFRLLSNLLASTEAAVERFFNRSAIQILDVLEPVDRSLKLLQEMRSEIATPDIHAEHSHRQHNIFSRLDLGRTIGAVMDPIAKYRASLFTYGDSVDSHMDGTALDTARRATQQAMHSARLRLAQESRRMDVVFAEYQSESIATGARDERIFVVVALLGVVAAIIVTFLVQRRIRSRLEIVRQGARRISGGDLDSRIEIPETDGLGELAREFNTMADTLQARDRQISATQRELENLNRDLERRVEIRSAQLRESEQRLQHLIESTHEGFWFIDLNGRTSDVNPAMCRILGRPREEILGKTIFDFVDAENEKIFRNQLAKRKSGESSAYEIALTRPDGSNVSCLNNATPLYASTGEKIGSVGIWADITEINETHRVLEIEKERADQASRAKSEFLATMSHEIRTPMNGVLGMTNLLLRTDLDTEQHRFAARIKQSGEALLDLLNDILDISKIEAGRVELEVADFELPRLLLEVDAIMQSRALEKGLGYETDMVRIHVSHEHLGGDLRRLRFEVADTGIGIEAHKLNKVFEKFSQADASTTREYGGTGLGLAICRDLVELMDGDVGLESEPGQGSTFWFHVTCEISHGETPAEGPKRWVAELGAAAGEEARTLRVLLAEDNPVNQEIAVAVLEHVGHEVTVVENGAEAVAEVRNAPYDIVLMDMQMPVMDGIAATKAIRALPGDISRIPVVALTANAMVGDRERYMASGMNDYVSKPFNPDELLATISHWGDGPGGADPAPARAAEEPAASPGAAGEDVLDRSVIDPLRDAKPDFWKRLVGIYMETAPDNLQKLESALSEADCPTARMMAHSLKSSSANMGAMRLSDLCRRMEAAAAEEKLEASADLLTEINREFENVSVALSRDRDSSPQAE
jgi:PAS domain S-box-containing protein